MQRSRQYYITHPDKAAKLIAKKNRREKNRLERSQIFCAISSSLIFFMGISIPVLSFGYQILMYLKNGVWFSMSIIAVLNYLGSSWARYPHDWIGLWDILNRVHFSIPLAMLCFLISYEITNKT